jgi:hypothetical protein
MCILRDVRDHHCTAGIALCFGCWQKRNPAYSACQYAGVYQPAALLISLIPLPQALLWDCDGVLCDTERDGHRLAFNEAFKQKGLGKGVALGAVNAAREVTSMPDAVKQRHETLGILLAHRRAATRVERRKVWRAVDDGGRKGAYDALLSGVRTVVRWSAAAGHVL